MADTIYRQAAIDAIYKCTDIYVTNLPPMIDKAEAYKTISDLPSAQPERTGKWIRHLEQRNIYGGKTIECSECQTKYVVQYIEDEKYCRNCGARMES